MRENQLLKVTATIAAGAAMLTACGDDATEALSKPEFVQPANTMCQEVRDELEPTWEAMWMSLDGLDVCGEDG
jgi:hypothetical protein